MQKYVYIAATLVITSCALASSPSKSLESKIAKIEQEITGLHALRDNHPKSIARSAFNAMHQFLATTQGLEEKSDPASVTAERESDKKYYADVHTSGTLCFGANMRILNKTYKLEQEKTKLCMAEIARLNARLSAQSAATVVPVQTATPSSEDDEFEHIEPDSSRPIDE